MLGSTVRWICVGKTNFYRYFNLLDSLSHAGNPALSAQGVVDMNIENSSRDVISSARIEGTDVYDSDGNKLGTIDHLVIEKKSGQVHYAVMEFGGLLGVGTDRYPIPWHMLQYEATKQGYLVPLNKAQLEGAPRFSGDNAPQYDDAYNSSVKTYCGF